ncbi:MAG TPA: type I DNA topoisomerase [Holophaga sp.]|nr:type I DNA topoisomerase [Holophaga sp.]HPS66960.1 type I DNA topoisomerase [Holophaga sp.]
MATAKKAPVKKIPAKSPAKETEGEPAPAGPGRRLVIVESPSKAKTITKYLGKGHKVMASVGHVRDLPTKEAVEVGGQKVPVIDVENGFKEIYEVPISKAKVVAGLKAAVKEADELILATDPDREGEAISWHLLEAIKPPKSLPVKRVLFNEITPSGIQKAMASPTEVDRKLVDAQRARRVLDRLVGYKVSQVLWDKVRRGLSAGRVQSVAVRLIVDREREIQAFDPVEYWVLKGQFAGKQPPPFWMKLTRLNGQSVQSGNRSTPRRVGDEKQAHALRDQILEAAWKVTSLETKEKKRNPPAPFTTAKLQQESAQKLKMSVSRTMANAQRLYEGVDFGEGPVGLITYMRTDSPRLAPEAVEAIRNMIQENYGRNYLPHKARVYVGKAGAQDAHEAIRPTDITRTPESLRGHLEPDQFRLYALIWRRTLASQMESARFDDTTVQAETTLASGEVALFEAVGEVEKFPGWLAAYRADHTESVAEQIEKESAEDEEDHVGLPELKAGEALKLGKLEVAQQFTRPPARFNEATLVKELEEDGIGRPSTYASIIATILDRDYVKKVEGRFKPTEVGMVVTDLLVQGFQELMDPKYTSGMETQLDRVEEGEITFLKAMKDFYGPFEKLLNRAGKEMANLKAGIPSDKVCKKCGAKMLKRIGKNGLFLGCSKYPDCDHTEELEPLDEPEDAPECPLCGTTPMTLRKGQWGPFWACPNYPACKGIVKADPKGIPVPADVPLDEKCPTCGKNFVKRHGRYGEFVCCVDYPKCKTVKKEILGVPCPKCGGDLSPRKTRFGKVFYGCTKYPKCDFTAWDKPVPRTCPQCKNNYMVEKTRKPRGKDPIQVILCPKCGHEEPLG